MIAALLPALAVLAQAPPGQDSRSKSFPDLGLTITLPAAFTEVSDDGPSGAQIKNQWMAKLAGTELEIALYVLPIQQFGFDEPEDVTALLLENLRDPKRGYGGFFFENLELVAGPFGFVPYASIGRGPLRDKAGTKVTGTMTILGGMLEKHGYCVQVAAEPALSDTEVKTVREFLAKGVVFKGAMRIAKWTDEEIRTRWKEDAPESVQKDLEVIRTDHYVILTNSSGGKKFAEKMEECYATIKKIYPFQDVAGQKLMPVFLFKMEDEYHDFLIKNLEMTREEADRTAGIASGDFYATTYEAPNDPTHIHEATHQIFANRLRLGGGGSWFQEGVAEYVETKPNDRNVAARHVKKREHVPLAKLVEMRSLIFSSKAEDVKGGDEAAELYKQAALLIEFLRESKWGKDKFQDFIHAVGLVPRNNVVAIERAVQKVYGTDLAGLEAKWVEYCQKR